VTLIHSRWLALLILASTIPVNGFALPVRHYDAQITPLAIAQDSEGFLWLATASGIFRFDGLHFEPVQPPGFDLTRATHIAAGNDGSIWIGAEKGLFRWNNGEFSLELPGRIEAMTVTGAGRVLATVAPNTSFHVLMEPAKKPRHWSNPALSIYGQFHNSLDGRTYFNCGDVCVWSDADLTAAAGGGASWERELPHIQLLLPPSPNGPRLDWAEVVATPDHRLWGRDGPDIVRAENGRIAGRSAFPVQTSDGGRPAFFLDGRGRLWIPSRRMSFIDDGMVHELPVSEPRLDDVTAVFEDRRGTMWFGLPGKGLAALPDEALLESWSDQDGIPAPVNDLAWHPTLGMLLATDAGAFKFDPKQRRWSALQERAAEPTPLRSVAANADGSLLALPYRGGLMRSTNPFLSWVELPLGPDVARDALRRFYHDRQGNILIGTTDQILTTDARGITGKISLPGKGTSLDGARIPELVPAGKFVYSNGTRASDMWAAADGQMWVGYEGGIAACTSEACRQVVGPNDGLLDVRIRSLAPNESGDVWVAYRQPGGFTRLRKNQGRWIATHFRPENGFGPRDTTFVRLDRRGWIWRAATDGVYVSDGRHTDQVEDWIHLTFGDRANANHISGGSFLEEPDGTIWIGTEIGVVRLHPTDDWFRGEPRVSQVRWGGHDLDHLPAKLPGGRQDLEIHLSQPGMLPFQSRMFRYRLLPGDSKWRYGSDGTAVYRSLGAGSYRFELASAEGNPAIVYPFRVQWQSSFLVTFWLAVAAVIAGAEMLRRRRKLVTARSGFQQLKQQFLEGRDSRSGSSNVHLSRLLGLYRRKADLPDVSPLRAAILPGTPRGALSGALVADRYKIELPIASGTFSTVYLAHDLQHGDANCAIKIFRIDEQERDWLLGRLAQEIEALKRVSHPNIVAFLDAGKTEDGHPFLAMEYVSGPTLRSVLLDGAMDPKRIGRIAGQMGYALGEIHQRGIFHRDLKPENLIVDRALQIDERVVLVDFSIAIVRDPRMTLHGQSRAAGSLPYMAPEQLFGYCCPATDIYALALIVFEMLTGKKVSELGLGSTGDLSGEIHRALAEVCPMVSRGVLEALAAAVAFEPTKRPQDARAFGARLALELNPS